MFKRIHFFVEGKVQGVGFRYQTQRKALQVGLVGWVRNVEDGRVEVLVEGSSQATADFLEWCKKGPPSAAVTGLDIKKSEEILEASEKSFEIRP